MTLFFEYIMGGPRRGAWQGGSPHKELGPHVGQILGTAPEYSTGKVILNLNVTYRPSCYQLTLYHTIVNMYVYQLCPYPVLDQVVAPVNCNPLVCYIHHIIKTVNACNFLYLDK